MKKMFVFMLLVVMMLSGCSDTELPPEPGDIGSSDVVGDVIKVYDGYGVPNDVFADEKQIFFLSDYVFNLDPDTEILDLELSVNHEGALIYKYGFYYTENGWERFEFPQETVSGSRWIAQKASTLLDIPTSELSSGENYVVTYSCKKHDGEWKCGCSSESGPCDNWMLQTFLYRNVDLPPEPLDPNGIITTRLYLSPTDQIYKLSDDDIDIIGTFESTRENIVKLENLKLEIQTPEGNTEYVTLEQYGDVSCKAYQGENSENLFNCYARFMGGYNAQSLGEYKISYSVDTPEWLDVQAGGFKVISDDSDETCQSDLDCPSPEKKTSCRGNSSCTSSVNYFCFDGKCNGKEQVGSCTVCPNGCEDGACVESTACITEGNDLPWDKKCCEGLTPVNDIIYNEEYKCGGAESNSKTCIKIGDGICRDGLYEGPEDICTSTDCVAKPDLVLEDVEFHYSRPDNAIDFAKDQVCVRLTIKNNGTAKVPRRTYFTSSVYADTDDKEIDFNSVRIFSIGSNYDYLFPMEPQETCELANYYTGWGLCLGEGIHPEKIIIKLDDNPFNIHYESKLDELNKDNNRAERLVDYSNFVCEKDTHCLSGMICKDGTCKEE